MARKLLEVKGVEYRPVMYSGTDRQVTAEGFWWIIERVDGMRWEIPFKNVLCVACGRIHPGQVVNKDHLLLVASGASTRAGSEPRPIWSVDPVRIFVAVCPRCECEYLSSRHDSWRVCPGCIGCESRMLGTL